LRLVYVNPTGVIGGAEMCLLDLLASLRSSRPDWSPHVVLGDDGPLRSEVERLGVPCDVLPLPTRLAALGDAGLGLGPSVRLLGRLALAARGVTALASVSSYLVRLRRRLRRLAPDLVQTNGMKAHVLGAWAAPRGLPVVWHLHDYLGTRPVMGRLLRGSVRRGVRGVAVSDSVAADATSVLGPRVPVSVAYNAVDLARFRPGPGDGAWLDAAAGFRPAGPGPLVRVGLVATFARWKGHEVFLEAVSRVSRDMPARFYVVGGPIYRSTGSQHDTAALRAHAAALGVADRVGFTGHQSDPAAVFRALDVVVHASTRPEPFGRVIVEAMACGRAVVAAPLGGAAELIEDGASALACPPGDPAALAVSLTRLIVDPALRARLGRGGRAEAEARFDRARLAGEWSRVYEDALAHRTAGWEGALA
jgi:glycosyltransferase involved in cell wall biosynthesis